MADDPYQLSVLRTKVRDALNEASEGFWLDTEIDSFINEAIRDIAEKSACVEDIQPIATTAGIRYVSYAGIACQNLDYKPSSGHRFSLIQRDARSFGRLQKPGAAPQYFADLGGNVWIDPLPGDIYYLDAYTVLDVTVDLTDDEEVPVIPEAFRNLIVPRATAMALTKEQRYAVAKQLMSIYMNELNYLKQVYVDIIPDTKDDLRYQ